MSLFIFCAHFHMLSCPRKETGCPLDCHRQQGSSHVPQFSILALFWDRIWALWSLQRVQIYKMCPGIWRPLDLCNVRYEQPSVCVQGWYENRSAFFSYSYTLSEAYNTSCNRLLQAGPRLSLIFFRFSGTYTSSLLKEEEREGGQRSMLRHLWGVFFSTPAISSFFARSPLLTLSFWRETGRWWFNILTFTCTHVAVYMHYIQRVTVMHILTFPRKLNTDAAMTRCCLQH